MNEGHRFPVRGKSKEVVVVLKHLKIVACMFAASAFVVAPALGLSASAAPKVNEIVCQPGSTVDNPCTGTNGADHIVGTSGDDYIVGGSGNDHIEGGDGNDTIFGNNGKDTLDGGTGDDTISGGNGKDTITGADGHATIAGHYGQERLRRGPGDD